MTVMISPIFVEARVISRIELTAETTTVWPRSAVSRESRASRLACRALSAFCLTVPESCSSDAAVSSRAEACS